MSPGNKPIQRLYREVMLTCSLVISLYEDCIGTSS